MTDTEVLRQVQMQHALELNLGEIDVDVEYVPDKYHCENGKAWVRMQIKPIPNQVIPRGWR